MIMERNLRDRRSANKLRGLGEDDTYDYLPANDPVNYPDYGQGGGTIVDDDGSTITYDAEGNVISSTPATDLPVQSYPVGTALTDLLSDPGKLIKVGTQIYRYYRTQNAQGQYIYRPLPYYGSGANPMSNPLFLLALAAGAFLLLS